MHTEGLWDKRCVFRIASFFLRFLLLFLLFYIPLLFVVTVVASRCALLLILTHALSLFSLPGHTLYERDREEERKCDTRVLR